MRVGVDSHEVMYHTYRRVAHDDVDDGSSSTAPIWVWGTVTASQRVRYLNLTVVQPGLFWPPLRGSGL